MYKIDKINDKGLKLLEYKRELSKEYPLLIKESLILALEQLAEAEVVDTHTLQMIKDEEQHYEGLKEYMESNSSFIKSDEEIFKEFEVLREKLDNLLELKELDRLELYTESYPSKDYVLVNKQFSLDADFTKRYFDVSDKDVTKLMKRKGFVEKFAVLRLMAVFKPFVEEVMTRDLDMKIQPSCVYYYNETDAYAIDILFEIPIGTLIAGLDKKESNEVERLCDIIEVVSDEAAELFEENFS